jgi:hypothetical protein
MLLPISLSQLQCIRSPRQLVCMHTHLASGLEAVWQAHPVRDDGAPAVLAAQLVQVLQALQAEGAPVDVTTVPHACLDV